MKVSANTEMMPPSLQCKFNTKLGKKLQNALLRASSTQQKIIKDFAVVDEDVDSLEN